MHACMYYYYCPMIMMMMIYTARETDSEFTFAAD